MALYFYILVWKKKTSARAQCISNSIHCAKNEAEPLATGQFFILISRDKRYKASHKS